MRKSITRVFAIEILGISWEIKPIQLYNMEEKKKYRIEYLDINDDLYIENDELKKRVRDGTEPKSGTWSDLRDYVLDALYKMKKYEEEHNQGLQQ